MAAVELQAQIQDARTPVERVTAFRALKNELIGHNNIKARWVQAGVLTHIVAALYDPEGSESGRDISADSTRLRVQALQILSSLALGGPEFLAPIYAAHALPAVLYNIRLDPFPAQVSNAALKVLINLALSANRANTQDSTLADGICFPNFLRTLYGLLKSPAQDQSTQEQVNHIGTLLATIQLEEPHRTLLADYAVLDALTTKLASIIVREGYALPGADTEAEKAGIVDLFPSIAPRGVKLDPILGAIGAIIKDSSWRSALVVYSPSLTAIFPLDLNPPAEALKHVKSYITAYASSRNQSYQGFDLNLMDGLVPVIPETPPSRSVTFSSMVKESQPPLAEPRNPIMDSRWRGPKAQGSEQRHQRTHTDRVVERESPLIPWLLDVARSSEGTRRVLAASLVTSLLIAGLTRPTRDAQIGAVLIPLLLRDISGGYASKEALRKGASDPAQSLVDVQALDVFGRLVAGSKDLQRRAYSGGAVPILSKVLRKAKEVKKQAISKQTSSQSLKRKKSKIEGTAFESVDPWDAYRRMLRLYALKAIAALALEHEDIRKAFLDQSDIVPSIVRSLNLAEIPIAKLLQDSGIGLPQEPAELVNLERNDVLLLVAACDAARVFTRSTHALRTVLQDCDLATPILALLQHPDTNVQHAAGRAMCNLVTDMSPMRDKLCSSGIVKVLCNHAHSHNAALRLNALWAFKHLITGVDAVVKKEIFEELTSGWLVQLICDNTEDEALSQRQNAPDSRPDRDGDVDMGQDEGEDQDDDVDIKAPWATTTDFDDSPPTPPFFQSSRDRSRTPRMLQSEGTIQLLRAYADSPTRIAHEEDLAIQEMALSFIRNFIAATQNSSAAEAARGNTEMIDFLFDQVGQERLFSILESKIAYEYTQPLREFHHASGSSSLSTTSDNNNNSNNNNNNNRETPRGPGLKKWPQAMTVKQITYILVHMSASIPRHRQIVVSQTKLLLDLIRHFTSRDKEIRLALCHLVTNLTWQDDAADSDGAARRALILHRLGLVAKTEKLMTEDPELDVRERAKEAAWQAHRAMAAPTTQVQMPASSSSSSAAAAAVSGTGTGTGVGGGSGGSGGAGLEMGMEYISTPDF